MASWDVADHFRIPLLDGSFGLGQIVARLDTGPLILLTLRRTAQADAPILSITLDEVISLLRTTDSAIGSALWPICGFDSLPRPRSAMEIYHAPAQVYDPEIIEAYVNACHGLIGWDSFPDKLFDGMMFGGMSRPATARSRV